MKSIIIGTAGHIDHGKTALVKALTGIDADRLAEEKRRGITIDLGFAHVDLPGDNGEILRLGFVDVPGHERFVRNMLAGVGGIDLVLLVIAADESIKPQTREHFDILQLMGVKRGITVLTKADAVDADMLDVVRLEVEEFLKGTFLEPPKSDLIAVSALTGSGLGDLRQAIARLTQSTPVRNSEALARLPIDRVFTMKGFGTVVTGTLLSGTIHQEDELEVFPTGRRVRVRGVHVYGRAAAAATAGQRTALNLARASTEDLRRGMSLAPSATLKTTRLCDVDLSLLRSAPRSLKNRARVHFHSNTVETIAELKLSQPKEIAPGEAHFARIKLSEPVLLLPGDRFIIRQFSPVITIGGGIILDAAPVQAAGRPRKSSGAVEGLEILASGERDAILALRVSRSGARGLSIADAIAETGWDRAEILKLSAQLNAKGQVVQLQDRLFGMPEFKLARARLLHSVTTFHEKDPLHPGMSRSEVQDEMFRGSKMAVELFESALSSLVKEKRLEAAADVVRVPGYGSVLKDDEAESKKKIEDAFATTGLRVPALNEVLAGLTVDRTRAQKIVTMLLRDRILIKVSQELVFHRAALEALRRQLSDYKKNSPKIDVTQFKLLTGVSRKYAIPLLEYLDRERITKRVGDAREILS
jgi:selenocysteine-specific elongation factor